MYVLSLQLYHQLMGSQCQMQHSANSKFLLNKFLLQGSKGFNQFYPKLLKEFSKWHRMELYPIFVKYFIAI